MKKQIISLVLTMTILFSFLPVILEGQSKIDGYSINPKLGIALTGGGSGPFLGIEINILKNNLIYSIDYYHGVDDEFFGPSPDEYYNQVGFMIGEFTGDKIFRFEYQIGIAPFWGIKRTQLLERKFLYELYDTENFYTMGFVMKLGFKIIPIRYLSIGIDLQANLNIEKTVFMSVLSVEFGNLRKKLKKDKNK